MRCAGRRADADAGLEGDLQGDEGGGGGGGRRREAVGDEARGGGEVVLRAWRARTQEQRVSAVWGVQRGAEGGARSRRRRVLGREGKGEGRCAPWPR